MMFYAKYEYLMIYILFSIQTFTFIGQRMIITDFVKRYVHTILGAHYMLEVKKKKYFYSEIPPNNVDPVISLVPFYIGEHGGTHCIDLLTLKTSGKPASENVVCLCRLLNILAKMSNLFLHTGKQCGP